MTSPSHTGLSTERQNKLNRLGQQLSITEKLLENHPLTQSQWGIIQETLHYLNLETRWASGGPKIRLLMALQTALLSHETEDSEAGLFGPHLMKTLNEVVQLMSVTLPPHSLAAKDLLLSGTQLISVFVVYIATQILGNWKGTFPHTDKGAAKKGGQLLQELGLTILFNSKTVLALFDLIGQALEIEEPQRKILKDVGQFYILILLLIAIDQQEELTGSLIQFLKNSMNSVELALDKANSRGLIEDDRLMAAASYLQLLRQTIDNKDLEAIPKVIESGFQAFDVPFDEIKNDVKKLIKYCSQLNKTFYTAFYKIERSMTTVDQAA